MHTTAAYNSDCYRRARTAPDSNTTRPPLDLDLVAARLEAIPADRRSPSPADSSTGSHRTWAEDDPRAIRFERECDRQACDDLLAGGGRPSHPFDLADDIAKDMEEYREIVTYWLEYPRIEYDGPGGKTIWRYQRHIWSKFRENQRREREYTSPSSFPQYCEHLHARLKKHGIEYPAVELKKDLDQQTKLATWLEFLRGQCVEYDRAVWRYGIEQVRRDKAWKKLVDSKVLEPSEVETGNIPYPFKFGIEGHLQLWAERDAAKQTLDRAASGVESAEKALQDAKSANITGSPLLHMEQDLSMAKSRLSVAEESYQQAERRYTFIKEYMDDARSYYRVKDLVPRELVFLRWIRDQIPLIESGLDSWKAAEITSAEKIETQRWKGLDQLKRGYEEDKDEATGERAPKRQRQDEETETDISPASNPSSPQ